ncbi:glycosyltransferase [Paenibacillus sp. Soil522]|uniref:glycosyltransferase n=1 Tax=Paenibacillus sp. Soil522 TaxID=1736388 RepID=UPI0006FD029C|nr:glycosyltransferase [Paenibacillus sp. Soil522]KRE47903.1 hypothetical protein ASG81_08295 [Paenibacillus sp. Soil522]
MENLPSHVKREKHFLLQEKVDLVISDISPVPFAAANQANITSVGISNFTWFTAYTQMLDEKKLEPLYRAYSYMDYFVSLAGGITEPRWGRRGYSQTGFFCRTPHDEEVNRLKAQFNPENAKIIVFFAVGMSIYVDDLKQMAMWNDDSCLFIVSNNMNADGDNIIRIPEHVTESQDYLAVCDIVITKPGWGTVSEAISLGKPLLLLERSSFLEDRNTVEALTELHPYRLMEWQELKHLQITRGLITSIKNNRPNRSLKNKGEPLQEIVNFIRHLVN